MKKQIAQIEEYERKILIGLRQLPLDKIVEVADFVEFLKTQSVPKTRLGDTLAQIREEFENAGTPNRTSKRLSQSLDPSEILGQSTIQLPFQACLFLAHEDRTPIFTNERKIQNETSLQAWNRQNPWTYTQIHESDGGSRSNR